MAIQLYLLSYEDFVLSEPLDLSPNDIIGFDDGEINVNGEDFGDTYQVSEGDSVRLKIFTGGEFEYFVNGEIFTVNVIPLEEVEEFNTSEDPNASDIEFSDNVAGETDENTTTEEQYSSSLGGNTPTEEEEPSTIFIGYPDSVSDETPVTGSIDSLDSVSPTENSGETGLQEPTFEESVFSVETTDSTENVSTTEETSNTDSVPQIPENDTTNFPKVSYTDSEYPETGQTVGGEESSTTETSSSLGIIDNQELDSISSQEITSLSSETSEPVSAKSTYELLSSTSTSSGTSVFPEVELVSSETQNNTTVSENDTINSIDSLVTPPETLEYSTPKSIDELSSLLATASQENTTETTIMVVHGTTSINSETIEGEIKSQEIESTTYVISDFVLPEAEVTTEVIPEETMPPEETTTAGDSSDTVSDSAGTDMSSEEDIPDSSTQETVSSSDETGEASATDQISSDTVSDSAGTDTSSEEDIPDSSTQETVSSSDESIENSEAVISSEEEVPESSTQETISSSDEGTDSTGTNTTSEEDAPDSSTQETVSSSDNTVSDSTDTNTSPEEDVPDSSTQETISSSDEGTDSTDTISNTEDALESSTQETVSSSDEGSDTSSTAEVGTDESVEETSSVSNQTDSTDDQTVSTDSVSDTSDYQNADTISSSDEGSDTSANSESVSDQSVEQTVIGNTTSSESSESTGTPTASEENAPEGEVDTVPESEDTSAEQTDGVGGSQDSLGEEDTTSASSTDSSGDTVNTEPTSEEGSEEQTSSGQAVSDSGEDNVVSENTAESDESVDDTNTNIVSDQEALEESGSTDSSSSDETRETFETSSDSFDQLESGTNTESTTQDTTDSQSTSGSTNVDEFDQEGTTNSTNVDEFDQEGTTSSTNVDEFDQESLAQSGSEEFQIEQSSQTPNFSVTLVSELEGSSTQSSQDTGEFVGNNPVLQSILNETLFFLNDTFDQDILSTFSENTQAIIDSLETYSQTGFSLQDTDNTFLNIVSFSETGENVTFDILVDAEGTTTIFFEDDSIAIETQNITIVDNSFIEQISLMYKQLTGNDVPSELISGEKSFIDLDTVIAQLEGSLGFTVPDTATAEKVLQSLASENFALTSSIFSSSQVISVAELSGVLNQLKLEFIEENFGTQETQIDFSTLNEILLGALQTYSLTGNFDEDVQTIQNILSSAFSDINTLASVVNFGSQIVTDTTEEISQTLIGALETYFKSSEFNLQQLLLNAFPSFEQIASENVDFAVLYADAGSVIDVASIAFASVTIDEVFVQTSLESLQLDNVFLDSVDAVITAINEISFGGSVGIQQIIEFFNKLATSEDVTEEFNILSQAISTLNLEASGDSVSLLDSIQTFNELQLALKELETSFDTSSVENLDEEILTETVSQATKDLLISLFIRNFAEKPDEITTEEINTILKQFESLVQNDVDGVVDYETLVSYLSQFSLEELNVAIGLSTDSNDFVISLFEPIQEIFNALNEINSNSGDAVDIEIESSKISFYIDQINTLLQSTSFFLDNTETGSFPESIFSTASDIEFLKNLFESIAGTIDTGSEFSFSIIENFIENFSGSDFLLETDILTKNISQSIETLISEPYSEPYVELINYLDTSSSSVSTKDLILAFLATSGDLTQAEEVFGEISQLALEVPELYGYTSYEELAQELAYFNDSEVAFEQSTVYDINVYGIDEPETFISTNENIVLEENAVSLSTSNTVIDNSLSSLVSIYQAIIESESSSIQPSGNIIEDIVKVLLLENNYVREVIQNVYLPPTNTVEQDVRALLPENNIIEQFIKVLSLQDVVIEQQVSGITPDANIIEQFIQVLLPENSIVQTVSENVIANIANVISQEISVVLPENQIIDQSDIASILNSTNLIESSVDTIFGTSELIKVEAETIFNSNVILESVDSAFTNTNQIIEVLTKTIFNEMILAIVDSEAITLSPAIIEVVSDVLFGESSITLESNGLFTPSSYIPERPSYMLFYDRLVVMYIFAEKFMDRFENLLDYKD